MKKIISCVALFGVSLGLASSAFAQSRNVCRMSTNNGYRYSKSYNTCVAWEARCLTVDSTCNVVWL